MPNLRRSSVTTFGFRTLFLVSSCQPKLRHTLGCGQAALCRVDAVSRDGGYAISMSDPIAPIAARLVESIAVYGSVGVAFSGGVDSSVVAQAARLALRDSAIAVIGVGPALAAVELKTARSVAAAIGIELIEVEPDELASAGYVANAGDRCYHCKTRLYDATRTVAAKRGLAVVANGTNKDDLGDYRPGLVAAGEHSVRSPLVELGIGKSGVRALAEFWQLEVWDKPASPCLASRIAPGVEVTGERLSRIEQAEEIVRNATGLRELRVRIEQNELARIEVPHGDLARVAGILVRDNVAKSVQKLGFRRVTLDLAGLQSGNLNELVPLQFAESAG